MKKLLVTGISSFLGNELAMYPQQHWKISGLFHKKEVHFSKVDCHRCDITNEVELNQIFNQTQPDAVIHLAALTNPNYCELHPEESFRVNVEATIHLAQLCEKAQIPVVFTSTDLVFDGDNAPYDEKDEPMPIMVYGRHKAKAEQQILALYDKAIIARIPLIFGNGGFMKNWVETLKNGGTLTAFTDEFRTMISATKAIEGLLLLLEKKLKGIWHLGGKESISRYDFAVKMAVAFNLPKDQIFPSIREKVEMPAARPADVSLDSWKAYEVGFDPMRISDSLKKLNQEI